MIWIKIILYVLYLIALGIERETAIDKAASLFGVSSDDLERRVP